MNQPELDPQKALEEEVTNYDNLKLETMKEVTNHDDRQPETMEEVTNCDDPQPEAMKEVTNLADPELDTMEEVTNHDDRQPEIMEEVTNCDDPQPEATKEVTNLADSELDAMEEVTNHDDRQPEIMEEVTNCDDPQPEATKEVTNLADPELDTMEEVTNHDDRQPEIMEEVTNCDDPQPEATREVTNLADPELDTMEEVTNHDDRQPEIMEEVTNCDDPQPEATKEVTNLADPELDTMEEVTNHDDRQPEIMEEVTNCDDPQPEATKEVTNLADPELDTMEEVTNHDDRQPEIMEEVTNCDDPQPEAMKEVTNLADPQQDTMEEVTNLADPQPETMEEVTNLADPQQDTMDEVTNLADPQQDTMEEVTNHNEPQLETAETPEALTILDILNADCWRVILDHLYINDILLSESVSRAWQQMVNEYFTGVHKYQVGSGDSEENHYDYQIIILKNNKESSKEFVAMITRFGPLIVKLATNYVTRKGYQAIAANCPNLEDLTLYTLQINLLIQRFPKVYNKLKRLKFEWCDCLEDDCLSVMVLVENMEELTINQFEVPATFMSVLKWSRLKTLSINYCEYLLFDDRSAEFFSAIEPNYILRKLVLDRNSTRVIWDMCFLLRNLPNLEELSIKYCKMMECSGGNELVEAIGGLRNLKHLNLKRNNNVSDALLEAVARGCKDLRTLNIGYCVALSGSAVTKMCQELPKLTELYVAGVPKITDNHLIKCITACPDLKELDASGCARVSARLVAAARARARPLRLRLMDTTLTAPQVVEELSQGGRKPRLWAPVPGCFWTRKVTRMAQAGDITLIWNESPVVSSSSSDQDIATDLWRVFKKEKEEE